MYSFGSKNLSGRQRKLLRMFGALSEQNRAALLAFAEFLIQKDTTAVDPSQLPQLARPRAIERPEQESVVAAIKRLSETYYMLQREHMLDETSALMTAHILQGRPADAVIDDLEALFLRHYQSSRDSEQS